MTRIGSLAWDAYRKDAEGDEWAVTDRGWLTQEVDDIGITYGHYLDYGPCHPGEDGPQVHAVRYTPQIICTRIGEAFQFQAVGKEAKMFVTVAGAQSWIQGRAVTDGMLWPAEHPISRRVA